MTTFRVEGDIIFPVRPTNEVDAATVTTPYQAPPREYPTWRFVIGAALFSAAGLLLDYGVWMSTPATARSFPLSLFALLGRLMGNLYHNWFYFAFVYTLATTVYPKTERFFRFKFGGLVHWASVCLICTFVLMAWGHLYDAASNTGLGWLYQFLLVFPMVLMPLFDGWRLLRTLRHLRRVRLHMFTRAASHVRNEVAGLFRKGKHRRH